MAECFVGAPVKIKEQFEGRAAALVICRILWFAFASVAVIG
jgi:hypothetical protein